MKVLLEAIMCSKLIVEEQPHSSQHPRYVLSSGDIWKYRCRL